MARKKKVLIELENGSQSVEFVDVETGSFKPGVKIVWDEALHGAMPSISEQDLGGYSKSGNSFVVDRSKADTQYAKVIAKADRKTELSDARAAVKVAFSDPKVPDYVKNLICALNLDI